MKMAVFWVVAPCSGRSLLAFQRSIIRVVITLMMEAARTSEILVNFYQTTCLYNPEDSHLCAHRHENLKSQFEILLNS
jgi:hypothetical protein